jgi:hypothetical protein
MDEKEVPTCPVCGPIPNGHTVSRCVIADGEKEREFNRTRLERWRDDRGDYRRANEFPTVHTVITCAEDLTDFVLESVFGEYVLVIGHVDTFRGNINGKGFMPRVYHTNNSYCNPGLWKCNFNVYQTYNEAVFNGKRDMLLLVEQDAAKWAEFEAEQERIKVMCEARDGQ